MAYDLIGDILGCFRTLEALLQELGYTNHHHCQPKDWSEVSSPSRFQRRTSIER